MKFTWFNRRIVRVLYVLFSIVLLVFAAEIYLIFHDIIKKTDQIDHHNQARTYLLDSYSAFNQIETSTRGFLLLRDPLF